ncbi:hypothetical protein MIND_00313600 [Mycena indigotica]|uniref:Small secreted protein n=1 Tax=Mycena indigotica TaxID=2126181 RepID=A0A8H6T1S8_9AGAR|nr:uncharacterized protein MIND_00313600 [Mycena indigotica]KAF7309428.1 hypothetical protein MIND_00313600 [Mycena indigotica]
MCSSLPIHLHISDPLTTRSPPGFVTLLFKSVACGHDASGFSYCNCLATLLKMQSHAISALFLALLTSLATATPTPTPEYLTVTALVGKNDRSSFECWALTPAFVKSNSTGTVGALSYAHLGATTSKSSYTLFAQHTDAGLHNAPAAQYVFIMTGSGVLSFPTDNGTFTGHYKISAGEILIAADVAGTSVQGHNSVWEAGTSAIQMPFADGIPSHTVLYDGGCRRPHM